MGVADVVGLHVQALRLRVVVLEQFEHGAAGQPEERSLEADAGIADDPADVLDVVPRLAEHRLLAEQPAVELDRLVHVRHGQADVVQGGNGTGLFNWLRSGIVSVLS